MQGRIQNNKLIAAYMIAKGSVIRSGFGCEIEWQKTRSLSSLGESEFLQETAWVILCSGMREAVIRRLFSAVSSAFLKWSSAAVIARHRGTCEAMAVSVFHHPAKVAAIASMCERVAEAGFDAVRLAIQREGLGFLRTLDFIGPVTSFHLAKNIGLDVAKPDRHMTRIAKAAGLNSPHDLCRVISGVTGDRIGVVDLVLWRYATLNPRYLANFQALRRGM